MWKDPIVAETRALREQYAKQFNYDAEAIFQDVLRRQRVSSHKFVAFPARKPVSPKETVQQARRLGQTECDPASS